MTRISFTSKLFCLGKRKLREETRSMMDKFPHRSQLSSRIKSITNVDITSKSFIRSFHNNYYTLNNMLPNKKRFHSEVYQLWKIYHKSCLEIINLAHHIDYHKTCLLHKQNPYHFTSCIKPQIRPTNRSKHNYNREMNRFSIKLSKSETKHCMEIYHQQIVQTKPTKLESFELVLIQRYKYIAACS